MRVTAYRPDIDGLRAIAVLSVVFFHFDFVAWSGGYVGVDIFFVLSGYLITNIIVADVEAGTFSLRTFYVRRICRLLPATLVVCVVSVIVCWGIFSTPHFEHLGSALVAAQVFVANLFYQNGVGYFDISSSFKPLLHLWSLSIEEQFYMLWPFTVSMLVMHTRTRVVLLCLGLATLCSLGYAQMLVRQDSMIAFYSLPARMFEFGLGALCVWMPQFGFRSKMWSNCVATGALVGVMLCVVGYDDQTVFPGINALWPCLATAVLLLSQQSALNRRVLSHPALVSIGLWSYALYLVHWPIRSLYQYYVVRQLALAERVGLCALSLGCAYVLHRCVERPLRLRRGEGWDVGRTKVVVIVLAALLLLGIGMSMHFGVWAPRSSKGVASYTQADIVDLRKSSWRELRAREHMQFDSKRANILLIGDSTAKDVFNALHAQRGQGLPQHVALLRAAVPAKCQMMLGGRRVGRNLSATQLEDCEQRIESLLLSDNLLHADVIIMAASWSEEAAARLPATIAALQERSLMPIVVMHSKPYFPDVPSLIERYDEQVHANLMAQQIERRQPDMASHPAMPGTVLWYDLEEVACVSASKCDALGPEGVLLYYDNYHWTLAGASFFGERMRDLGWIAQIEKLLLESGRAPRE